jgi:hypothetical protein
MRHARWWTCAAFLLVLASPALASSVLGLSIEDQARLSQLVVTGEVIQQRGVLDPVGGVETEVTLVVTEAFKGDVRRGDKVVFHTRGGTVDGVVSEAVGEAKLKTGQEALVFIENVDGRLYNIGLSMGVWKVQGERGRAQVTRAVEEGLEIVGDVEVEFGPLSLTEMARRIDHAARNPEFEQRSLRVAPGRAADAPGREGR